jgi:MFS family permease
MEQSKQLKLNYKRTLIIGFAFFSILMVWQGYNFYCPLFMKSLLKDVLDEGSYKYIEFIVGAIMALDNVLALFMLPLFGKLSDKTKTKHGKRMPYILIGMAATFVIFPFMALCYIWNSLIGLIITMLVVLVIMNVYRSPAVALMPDVTPKPLRSTANGLINLVGYFGPIMIAVVNMVPFFKFGQGDTDLVKVFAPVVVVLISLAIAMIILYTKIKENKILEEMKEDLALGEELSQTAEKIEDDKPLSKRDKKNMWILLIAVCLWYMSFNAFETFNSTYTDDYYSTFQVTEHTSFEEGTNYYVKDGAEYELVDTVNATFDVNVTYYEKTESGTGIASLGTIILTVSSVVTFAVAGFFAVKFGRKANVLVGVGMVALGCLLVYLLGVGKSPSGIVYVYFAIMGIGWALINVNSYPMMVEMSSSGNIGKYTGYYYTASMLAQSFTPILMGGIIAFVPSITLRHLFLYSSIMAVLAFVVMCFFKENKNNIKEIKVGLGALDQD